MKRFRFALRPVAVVRAHKELRAREALALAIRAASEAEERHVAACGRMADLEAVISNGRRGRFRPSDEFSFHQAYTRECAAASELAKLLSLAQAETAKCREACIEANRQLKIVQRLEEKAKIAHRVEQMRAEQNELDEVAGFRAMKRNAVT